MSCYEEGDPRTAKLALVGEAPSTIELRLQRPFVGPAGEVLDQLLHAAGILRRDCYITNVFRHPVEQGESYVDERKGSVTPTALGEVAALRERLSHFQGNTILALGKLATTALTGRTKITKLRGSSFESTLLPGRYVTCTLHPASTLPGRGEYIWRYFIVSDLRKAWRYSNNGGYIRPERTLHTDPSFTQATEFLRAAFQTERLSLDIETSNHQVSCFAVGLNSREAMSVPLKDLRGWHRWSVENEMEIWRLLGALMDHREVVKLGQNFIFDSHFLFQQNSMRLQGHVQDTMILHHMLYPDFPKGLDFLTSIYTDEPYYKDDGKIWKKEGATEAEVRAFWLYNAKDAVVLFEIWDAIEPDAHKHGHWPTYLETVELLEPLKFMMTRGIRVDRDRLKGVKERIEKELVQKQQELNEICGEPLNVDSPKQCVAYFYGKKGLSPYLNKNGGPTVDDKALQRIIRKHHLREARLVQELRGLGKFLGTYLEIQLDEDARLRCSYNPRGTTTGRLSSSQSLFGTGANMQNLHPEMKDFLVAD